MAINESVGKEALIEPKKFLDNLIFRDAKHFVNYFLKKGFSVTGKGVGILSKKSYKLVRHEITGKHSSELDNKTFLKKVGNKSIREYHAHDIAGLTDKDLDKINIEDVKKSLSKYKINFTLVKNSYTGEIKFKMATKDSHIFEEVRENLINKIKKGKTIQNKRHSLINLYNHKDSKYKESLLKEKIKVSTIRKDKNKDMELNR